MCWCSNNIPKLITAEKDVPIYKILSPNMSAYFMFYKYELNKKYENKIGISDYSLGKYFIHEGFHSYSQKCDIIKHSYGGCKVIYNLIHICTYSFRCIIVEGFIPKDSKYFINELGEIVSNQIILTNVLEK